MRSVALLGAALALAACASVAPSAAPESPRENVAASDESVTIGLEAVQGGQGSHVWVANRSSVAVVVTSLTLSECQNVDVPCRRQEMRHELRPGRRERLLTVTPRDVNRNHHFRYHFTWEQVRASHWQ
jgi:hypothetical protein